MAYPGADLSQIPAAEPPPGIKFNFDNPESQAWMPRVAAYVTLPPMIIFLAMRIYARLRSSRFGLDDVFCIIGAAAILAKIGVVFDLLDNPVGPHMWNIPLSEVTDDYAKKTIVLATMYYISACFVKLSLLVLYHRVFDPSRTARILIWVGAVLTFIFYIIATGVFLGFCIPHNEDYALGGWLSLQYADRCAMVDGDIASAAGVVGAVLDLYILAIPLACLWGLRTSFHRKVGLSIVFMAGSAACIFSIIGTVYRLRITGDAGANKDYSWKTMPIYAFNLAEINIGIACSCVPIILVLFKSITNWSVTLVTRIKYATSGSRQKGNASGNSHNEMLPYHEMGSSELPGVARGTVTGLRTQIWNVGRTKVDTDTDVSTTNGSRSEMLTYASNDDDYYSHLKREHTRTRQGSSTT